MAATCMAMSLATSALPPLDFDQHARRCRCDGRSRRTAVDPHDPRQLEHLADAVEHVVLLLRQRRAGLLGRRLLQQLLGRLAPGPGGQLLGQVVGQLDELLAVGHRRAFAAQLDHRADCPPRSRHRRRSGRPRSRGPAGFPSSCPLLAQPVDRRVLVAAGLLQGLLAVHHGQAGPLAQRLDRRRGNLCHGVYLLACCFRYV